jgi:hypothetical protein
MVVFVIPDGAGLQDDDAWSVRAGLQQKVEVVAGKGCDAVVPIAAHLAEK